ncbi:MAG: muramoyl-pentapeptide carboxypeptidase [Parcubacteria group bacterium Gr01-1014_8]|nr:MAG: muramoyl-pentapeptide carboxypeptidase [Parcubacteria group bacterium Gr01-1014_8]
MRGMKKMALAFLFLVSLPLVSYALTADELRVQIEALLRQIEALQTQLGVNPQAQPTGGAPIQSGNVQCPYISRSLKLGSSGDDVARLQRFLALDPSVYPEAQVSGYYGPLTEAAIKRFQCKNKIVCDGSPGETGFGVTGPRTAALLALQCPDATANAGGFMRVSPISGPAPLPVSVDVTVNTTKSCAAVSYELDFGDSAPRVPINVPANACAEIRQLINHTYSSGGTFVVTLRSGTQQINATVAVTGSSNPNPSGDSLSASPTSGDAPLSVMFSGLVNSAGACNPGVYSVDFGDGQSTNININNCSSNSFSINHVYNSSSNYLARLKLGSSELRNVSIAVGGGTGQGGGYFSVSPSGSGDEFSVRADFELSSSCTRYDLDWGDGSTHASQSQGSCSSGSVTKQLSHTYTDAGNYTITLKRGSNLSSTDTVGVSIVY